jgi:hypothetical protein
MIWLVEWGGGLLFWAAFLWCVFILVLMLIAMGADQLRAFWDHSPPRPGWWSWTLVALAAVGFLRLFLASIEHGAVHRAMAALCFVMGPMALIAAVGMFDADNPMRERFRRFPSPPCVPPPHATARRE